jgi:hypothetical protein
MALGLQATQLCKDDNIGNIASQQSLDAVHGQPARGRP